MEFRYAELMELEELWNKALYTMENEKAQIKRSLDDKTRSKSCQEWYLVMKWDADRAKIGRHSKFDVIWSGTCIISGYKTHNVFQLSRLDGE